MLQRHPEGPRGRWGGREWATACPNPPSALYPPPHTYVPFCPPPATASWSRAERLLAKTRSWSGGMPDPLPPRLHRSKTQTCLIMINCCLDNQIQTQKVGDDSPRTRRERQGMCSLGKKRVSLPHTLHVLISSIANRINAKIIWEDSPGRKEAPVCVFPGQRHFFSVFSCAVSLTIRAALRMTDNLSFSVATLWVARWWTERISCHCSKHVSCTFKPMHSLLIRLMGILIKQCS